MAKTVNTETDELNLTRGEVEFCEAVALGRTKKRTAFRDAFPEQAATMLPIEVDKAAKKLAKDPRIVSGIERAENVVARTMWEALRARGLEIPEFRGVSRGPDTLKFRSVHRTRARAK